MTIFSVWAWDIETNTRLRWNEEAVEANLNDLAAAVERADEASRIGNVSYAESVSWRPSEADESMFWLRLSDTSVKLIDKGGPLDMTVALSGTGSGEHSGEIPLAGAQQIWVVYENGTTTIMLDRPQAVQ